MLEKPKANYKLVRLENYFDNNENEENKDGQDKIGLFRITRKYKEKHWIVPKACESDQQDDNKNERPIILSCVTMYDEKFDQMEQTISNMTQNFKEIQEADFCRDIPYNPKIYITIIVDGLNQFMKRENLEVFENFFQISQISNFFKDIENPTFELIDEKIRIIDSKLRNKTQDNSENDDQLEGFTDKNVEMKYEYGHLFTTTYNDFKVLFLVKHLNKRKLNSHLWFFSGFCRRINPNYCFLIDVGTLVKPYALGNLYIDLHKGADSKPKVAGVCGEIIPIMREATFTDVMVHAQKVEYKFSHILDKALESIIGFISVLPGAFSGYNYKCLEPDNLDGPLWGHYFFSLRMKNNISCYKANIYLAEDRILCSALVFSKTYPNILKYNSNAQAETDAPDTMFKLLSQRRRWINGSWFALFHSISMIGDMCESKHTCPRKSIFFCQIIYYIINVLYSFFLVGGFFLAFSICVREQFQSKTIENDRSLAGNLLILFYLMQLMLLVILSLGTKVKNVEQAFSTISVILSCYMLGFILLIIGVVMKNFDQTILIVCFVGTAAAFVLILCANSCIFQIFLSITHFVIATPTYVNIFTIYAMCNIHDVTWGNRADNQTKAEMERLEEFKQFRASWVLLWALTNGFLAYLLDALDSKSSDYGFFVFAIGAFGLLGLAFRFVGGMTYRVCCWTTSMLSDLEDKFEERNKMKKKERLENLKKEREEKKKKQKLESGVVGGSRV